MVIQIEGLCKSFKEVKAVNDLSFGVEKGGLFAFLGVNGAGKSTTINIIGGILKKDAGRVVICGEDADVHPERIKSKLGIVFQNSVLDKRLSVYDNLKSRAAMYGIFGDGFKKRLGELCDMLELNDLLKRPLYKLSGGQKRRIDIARALVHSPEVLILDEPTTGLDPKTRLMVWGVVENLQKDRGLTVFLTTHYMEEAANADYVVILDGGKKAAEGAPHVLKKRYASDFIRFYDRTEEAERVMAENGYTVERKHGYVEAELPNTEEAAACVLRNPEIFGDFEILKGNMDNVFLNVTGKNIAED